MPEYEVRVEGRLDGRLWSRWFDAMTVTAEGRVTVIRGQLPDQAALHGLLARLRDLALPVVSLRRLPEGPVSADH